MVNPVDGQSMAQFQSIIIRSRIRLCARMYPSVLLPQASHSVSALNTSHLQLCKNFPVPVGRSSQPPTTLCAALKVVFSSCLLSAPSHFSLHPIQDSHRLLDPPKLDEDLI